jgi:hypothetical protein
LSFEAIKEILEVLNHTAGWDHKDEALELICVALDRASLMQVPKFFVSFVCRLWVSKAVDLTQIQKMLTGFISRAGVNKAVDLSTRKVIYGIESSEALAVWSRAVSLRQEPGERIQ